MALTIALVGNPNCGKTTLFNQYTGNNQYVGNWPGVTVEQKKGYLRDDKEVEIVDLPGIYSLSPYTKEEVVARRYLASGDATAIVNIVDSTNLERNLYLTSQLMEFGLPVVVALNMMDIVRKRGYDIKTEELSRQLGVPCVEISALKGEGLDELMEQAKTTKEVSHPRTFSPELEQVITQVEERLPQDVPANLKRYYALKAFEGDTEAERELSSMPDVSDIVKAARKQFDDEPDAIIVNARYKDISSYIDRVHKKSMKGLTTSEKIDRVVTNRILALPIFVVVIALIYYIAISTVGGVATDWMNDGVFGEGWFLDVTGASQEQYDEAAGAYGDAQAEIAAYIAAAQEAGVKSADDVAALFVEDAETTPEDAPETLAVFMVEAAAADVVGVYVPEDEETGELLADDAVEVDAAVFAEALTVEEPDPADFGIWVPGIPVLIENGLNAIGCADWVKALVLDGIVSGVGAVLGFVPQILILFFLLAIVEGCGYMARVAFILDRIFRRFGLSGKTFIPMLIGTGCGVPAIMCSRTIESESARRLTVMTTTFMPCSAKLPLIALFAGAIFGGAPWVAPSCYFIGIASIIISGIMLKKTKPFLGDTTPFVMELPEYRLPRFVDLLRSMWERGWSFIKKAGTIILASCVIVWFLSSCGFENGAFGFVEDMDNSLLAVVGNCIAWLFAPLGWGTWQAAAATVTGLLAKENLVGTLGVLYAGDLGLWANLATTFVPAAALSLMLFNLLCAPCFAAMGAIRREMGGGKWFWAAVGYECGFAYCIALMVYQIGGFITGEVAFGPFTVLAIVVLIAMLYLLFRPNPAKRGKKAAPAQPVGEAA